MNESIATGEVYYLIKEKIINCLKLNVSEIAELIDQLDGVVVTHRDGTTAIYAAGEMAAMPTGQFAGLLQHLVDANIDGRISSPHREILDELAENVTKGEVDEVIHHIEPVDDQIKVVDLPTDRTPEENREIADQTMDTLVDGFTHGLIDYARELSDMQLSIRGRITEAYLRVQSKMETVFRTINENHPLETHGSGARLTLIGVRGGLAKKTFNWEISDKDALMIEIVNRAPTENFPTLGGVVLGNIDEQQMRRLLCSTTSPVPAEVRAQAAASSFNADDYLLIYHPAHRD